MARRRDNKNRMRSEDAHGDIEGPQGEFEVRKYSGYGQDGYGRLKGAVEFNRILYTNIGVHMNTYRECPNP